MAFRNPFAPKTVKSVLSEVYKAIDDLEIVAEQQEFIADNRREKILQLELEEQQAHDEMNKAAAVANRLRQLVEV